MEDYKLKLMTGDRVLIIGGLGFIGSNIAHKLVSLGADVTILDACLDPYGWNFANIKEIKDRITFVKGDIRDFDLIKREIKNKNLIFNCAAQVSHTISMKDPLLDIDINCKGNMTLLEAARAINDKVKIIYAGTRGEIGKLVYSPADENHPTNPTDLQGINKLAAEKYHLLYNSVYGINTCSLRINNTYGIRQNVKNGDYGILNWFVRKAILGELIQIYGSGNQTRDYNYVEDVVDAMILAAQSDKSDGQIYLLGSGDEIKFIDMVNKVVNIAKSLGYNVAYKQVPWPKEREQIEIGNFVVSYDKIKKDLKWYPKTSFDDGLKKTFNFYKERIKEYI